MPDPVIPSDIDLGYVKEGVVEIDPMSGRMLVRTETADGAFEFFDVQEALSQYEGEQVRIVVVPFKTINRIAQLVESGSLPVSEIPRAGG